MKVFKILLLSTCVLNFSTLVLGGETAASGDETAVSETTTSENPNSTLDENQGESVAEANSKKEQIENLSNSSGSIAGDKEIQLVKNLSYNSKNTEVSQSESLALLKTFLENLLSKNKDLLRARCEIMRGLGSVSKAIGDFLPDINLTAGYSIKEVAVKNDEGRAESHGESFGVNLNQNLFKGFGSVNEFKKTTFENKAKFAGYKAEEGKKIQEAIELLTKIISLEKILQFHEFNVKFNKEVLRTAVEKLKIGAIDRSEVAYTEGRLRVSEAKKIKVFNELESRKGDFELMTGFSLKGIKLSCPDFTSFIPETLEEMKSIAEKENSKILAANYALISSRADLHVSASKLAPKVDFYLSASSLAQKAKEGTMENGSLKYSEEVKKEPKGSFSTGIQLSMPLDIKGSARTDIKGARHNYRQFCIASEQTRGGVMSDLETLFMKISNYIKIIESCKMRIKASEVVLAASLQELAVGALVYSQTLKAQSDLNEARCELEENRQELKAAQVQLLNSLGRLAPSTFGFDMNEFNPLKKCNKGNCVAKKEAHKKINCTKGDCKKTEKVVAKPILA